MQNYTPISGEDSANRNSEHKQCLLAKSLLLKLSLSLASFLAAYTVDYWIEGALGPNLTVLPVAKKLTMFTFSLFFIVSFYLLFVDAWFLRKSLRK